MNKTPLPNKLEELLAFIRERLQAAPAWRVAIVSGDLDKNGQNMTGCVTIAIDVCPFCRICQSFHYADEPHILKEGQGSGKITERTFQGD